MNSLRNISVDYDSSDSDEGFVHEAGSPIMQFGLVTPNENQFSVGTVNTEIDRPRDSIQIQNELEFSSNSSNKIQCKEEGNETIMMSNGVGMRNTECLDNADIIKFDKAEIVKDIINHYVPIDQKNSNGVDTAEVKIDEGNQNKLMIDTCNDADIKKANNVNKAILMEVDDYNQEQLMKDITKKHIDQENTNNVVTPKIANEDNDQDKIIKDISNDVDMNYENSVNDPVLKNDSNQHLEIKSNVSEDSDSSSSDSSSDSDSSGIAVSDGESALDQDASVAAKQVKTRDEVLPSEIPLEDLIIALPEEASLELIGTSKGFVEDMLIIESYLDTPKLLHETVFFTLNKKPIGKIFDIFGPVKHPFYAIRVNMSSWKEDADVACGKEIYFAPMLEDLTQYIFVDKLTKLKGSDASWQFDQEPPAQCIEYSDDEEEAKAKAASRNAKRKDNPSNTKKAKPKKTAQQRNGVSNRNFSHGPRMYNAEFQPQNQFGNGPCFRAQSQQFRHNAPMDPFGNYSIPPPNMPPGMLLPPNGFPLHPHGPPPPHIMSRFPPPPLNYHHNPHNVSPQFYEH